MKPERWGPEGMVSAAFRSLLQQKGHGMHSYDLRARFRALTTSADGRKLLHASQIDSVKENGKALTLRFFGRTPAMPCGKSAANSTLPSTLLLLPRMATMKVNKYADQSAVLQNQGTLFMIVRKPRTLSLFSLQWCTQHCR